MRQAMSIGSLVQSPVASEPSAQLAAAAAVQWYRETSGVQRSAASEPGSRALPAVSGGDRDAKAEAASAATDAGNKHLAVCANC